MRHRRALYVSVTALLLTALVAPVAAAPKPPKKVCNLLVDPSGDGGGRIFFGNSPPTDVTNVDVGSNGNVVRAVMTVQTTNLSGNYQTLDGAQWSVTWNVGTTKYAFLFRKRTNSADVKQFLVDGGDSGVVPEVKVTDKTITWTVSRKGSHFSVLNKKKGQKFTSVTLTTHVYLGIQNNADAGTAAAAYTDQHPSCVF